MYSLISDHIHHIPRDGSDLFSGPAKQTGAHVVLPLRVKDVNLGAKRRREWSEATSDDL